MMASASTEQDLCATEWILSELLLHHRQRPRCGRPDQGCSSPWSRLHIMQCGQAHSSRLDMRRRQLRAPRIAPAMAQHKLLLRRILN